MLLLAAAHETGLLAALLDLISTLQPAPRSRLAAMLPQTLPPLLLTVLFLPIVGIHRLCALRALTGTGLAVLSGRACALGFRHVERFLAELVEAGAMEALTTFLARWSWQLWYGEQTTPLETVYVDSHRKPIYSDVLVPRGWVGRLSKVLSARTLFFLHDASGHPLFVITVRGDTHMVKGLPALLRQYEAALGRQSCLRIVVDREGMASDLLQQLVRDERVVVTLLRSNQYHGEDSFREIGSWTTLEMDAQGQVVREAAPARYDLAVDDPDDPVLPLWVALIRDYRRRRAWQDPSEAGEHRAEPAGADAEALAASVLLDPWRGEPSLTAIISTAEQELLALIATYDGRWPNQENSFRYWLLPAGLDSNAGYQKTEVENSEAAKRIAQQERVVERAQRTLTKARQRERAPVQRVQQQQAALQVAQQEQQTQAQREVAALEASRVRPTVKQVAVGQVVAAAEQQQEQLTTQLLALVAEEYAITQGSREAQREVQLQELALETLRSDVRPMYEVDDRKDQTLTVFRVLLVNLLVWLRGRVFPASMQQATWQRLLPFLQRPGRVRATGTILEVELEAFNDCALNRELAALCEQATAARLRIPDGRMLTFRIGAWKRPRLDFFSPRLE